MSLADIRDGNCVFIDANIFIYHFGGRSLDCKALLERCARRELLGYTSTPILAEVLHRRMVAEAIAKGLVTARTAGRKLAETPEVVKQLTQYQDDVSKIPYMYLPFSPHASNCAGERRGAEGRRAADERFFCRGLYAGTGAHATGDRERRLRPGRRDCNLQTD